MQIEIRCKQCNKPMMLSPSVAAKRHFCSDECYRKWASINIRGSNHHGYKRISMACSGCGKEMIVRPCQAKDGKKFCSHSCYSNSRKEKKMPWMDYTKPRKLRKGGRTHFSGYVFVKCNDHPKATKGGYVAEHVLMVEAVLGRYLPDKAVVHHVNSIRTDNRLDNLVICQDNNYHFLLHNRENQIKKENNLWIKTKR